MLPKEKRALSQIAPEWDNLIQPDRINRCRIRKTITALVAASARENVVVLKALTPRMAIKGIIRMAGKGGTGTNQCPLKNVKAPVILGLIRYNFPCRNA